MIATPITPGRVYRVRGAGLHIVVTAANPCSALMIAIGVLDIVRGAA